MEKQEKQKVQTHVPCQATPQTLPMGLNFFFGAFLVFSRFWPNCKKPWKHQKNKKFRPMSPAMPLPRPCPWVWTFFCVFFWFSRGFGQTAKNHGKTKKKKFRPMSPARPLPRPCPWVWTFCFFCFSMFFLHVFHVKMLSSQYLSKNVRFYNLHTCAPQAKLQKHMEKPKLI